MFLFLNSALFKAKIFMYFYFCLNSKWLPKDELCDLANPKPHWLQSPRAKIIKWSKAYLYILLDLTSAKRTTLRVVQEMLKDAKLAKPMSLTVIWEKDLRMSTDETQWLDEHVQADWALDVLVHYSLQLFQSLSLLLQGSIREIILVFHLRIHPLFFLFYLLLLLSTL